MKKSTLTRILLASVSVLILTIIHHVYGAVIYDTPFRLHIVYYALPLLLIHIFLHGLYKWNPFSRYGKIALWLFLIITLLVPVVTFGMIEGGYNHLLKNILYFAGVTQSTFDRLYSPLYEMPNDFWFEFTGILQFFLGAYTAFLLIKFWREK